MLSSSTAFSQEVCTKATSEPQKLYSMREFWEAATNRWTESRALEGKGQKGIIKLAIYVCELTPVLEVNGNICRMRKKKACLRNAGIPN